MATSKLTRILAKASEGKSSEEAFLYYTLRDSSVYLPLLPPPGVLSDGIINDPDAHQRTRGYSPCVVLENNERIIIPIFTEISFVEQWAPLPTLYSEFIFSELLSRLPSDKHIRFCINPGQLNSRDMPPEIVHYLNFTNQFVITPKEIDHFILGKTKITDKDGRSKIEYIFPESEDRIDYIHEGIRKWRTIKHRSNEIIFRGKKYKLDKMASMETFEFLRTRMKERLDYLGKYAATWEDIDKEWKKRHEEHYQNAALQYNTRYTNDTVLTQKKHSLEKELASISVQFFLPGKREALVREITEIERLQTEKARFWRELMDRSPLNDPNRPCAMSLPELERLKRNLSILDQHKDKIARRSVRRAKEERREALASAHLSKSRSKAVSTKKMLLVEQVCPYCGSDVSDGLHADHIYPLSLGGLSTFDNMVYVCDSCNLKKGSQTLREFIVAAGLDFNAVCERLKKAGKRF